VHNRDTHTLMQKLLMGMMKV